MCDSLSFGCSFLLFFLSSWLFGFFSLSLLLLGTLTCFLRACPLITYFRFLFCLWLCWSLFLLLCLLLSSFHITLNLPLFLFFFGTLSLFLGFSKRSRCSWNIRLSCCPLFSSPPIFSGLLLSLLLLSLWLLLVLLRFQISIISLVITPISLILTLLLLPTSLYNCIVLFFEFFKSYLLLEFSV